MHPKVDGLLQEHVADDGTFHDDANLMEPLVLVSRECAVLEPSILVSRSPPEAEQMQ